MFNIKKDPNEQKNIVLENNPIAKELKIDLDNIYQELISSNNLTKPPLIGIGNDKENPVILNRNDADGERGIWNQEEVFGKWNVKIVKGNYNIKFKFIKPIDASGRMVLETNTIVNQVRNNIKTDIIEMKNVHLPDMEGELIPFYLVGNKRIFPFWVEVKKN